MYNDFVVVGPKNDPAGISKFKSAEEVFLKLGHANKSFVSRGDNSGTHKKELKLWKCAKIKPYKKNYL